MTVLCDGSGCVAMEQPADLIAADHEGQLFLTTPSGDIPMIRLDGAPTARHAAAHAYAGTGPQISGALLTIAGDGTATLTRHARNGPARVTTAYGTCARL